MKKLGITLLAVAFSLPMFAAAKGQAAPSTENSQTQTTKPVKKHTKRVRRHHKKSANTGTAAPVTK